MKRLLFPVAAMSAMMLLSGCLALQVGGDKKEPAKATIGQQLIDLKTAQTMGVITPEEFAAQKAKLLNEK